MWSAIPKEYKILLAGTFVLGIFSGFYLYVTGFMPSYSEEAKAVELKSGLTIEGIQYGLCEQPDLGPCAVYRLASDGSLSVSASGITRNVNVADGTLRAINELVNTNRLREYSQELAEVRCGLSEVKTRFTLTIRSTEYVLDSCTTDFSPNSPLASILNSFFSY